MEWDEDLRYRFRGQFLEQGDNKMMLFAFDEPEMIKVEEIVLPPKENTEEDEGETVKKKIYIFPPEWAGTFGQPITSIAQVGILRQEHYAGNWDVFRPATEIEEMNIFTAESLNELLREAEKIMEGSAIKRPSLDALVDIANALDVFPSFMYILHSSLFLYKQQQTHGGSHKGNPP